MKVFCDTNILLEYIQQRREAQEVEQVLEYAEQNGHSLYISYGSFYTLTYLVEKYLKLESLEKESRVSKLREILNGVLDLFQFVGQSGDTMKQGVNDALFSDLEDSYQAHAAEAEGCDVLLTIDINHFSVYGGASAVSVLTPQQFIDTFISK